METIKNRLKVSKISKKNWYFFTNFAFLKVFSQNQPKKSMRLSMNAHIVLKIIDVTCDSFLQNTGFHTFNTVNRKVKSIGLKVCLSVFQYL